MHIIAIFGEAELGPPCSLVPLHSIPELFNRLGNPTTSGIGIHMAIQAILYEREVLYYHISQEGIHEEEYYSGFQILKDLPPFALALPGALTTEILLRAKRLCHHARAPLLATERDLYHFMTNPS